MGNAPSVGSPRPRSRPHATGSQLSVAHGGAPCGAPISLGPPSDLNYGAVAGGKFPGDYTGSLATHRRLYVVWCVSSTPSDPTAQDHQTMYAAVIRP